MMNVCPNCGGVSGFYYNLVMITHRIGSWCEDVDEEVDVSVEKFPKTVTCFDCTKRITWDIAHGDNKNS